MRFPRPRPAASPAFALAGVGEIATHEAWVERVHRRDGRVDVELVLEDGSAARLPLDVEQATWFEIEPGQIVGVRRRELPSEPGLSLVGECVNVCG